MGEESKRISYNYTEEKIMEKWKTLFEKLKNKSIETKK